MTCFTSQYNIIKMTNLYQDHIICSNTYWNTFRANILFHIHVCRITQTMYVPNVFLKLFFLMIKIVSSYKVACIEDVSKKCISACTDLVLRFFIWQKQIHENLIHKHPSFYPDCIHNLRRCGPIEIHVIPWLNQ